MTSQQESFCSAGDNKHQSSDQKKKHRSISPPLYDTPPSTYDHPYLQEVFFLPGSKLPLRAPFLVGNWKMNGTQEEILTFLKKFLDLYEEKKYLVTTLLAFPSVYLLMAQDFLTQWKKEQQDRQQLPVFIAAQDCSCHKNGPYTGQISASMLKDIGCSFTLLGHPECPWEDASYLEEASKKALKQDIVPLLCLRNVWEDLHRVPSYHPQGSSSSSGVTSLGPSSGKPKLSLCSQGDLSNPSPHGFKHPKTFSASEERFFCLLAYEPAVGAAEPPKNLEKDSLVLRKAFPHYPLLYGGGIHPENLGPLCSLFDGFLVGRASLTLETFFPLLEILGKHHESFYE